MAFFEMLGGVTGLQLPGAAAVGDSGAGASADDPNPIELYRVQVVLGEGTTMMARDVGGEWK